MSGRPWESDPVIYDPKKDSEPGAMEFMGRGLARGLGAPVDIVNAGARALENVTGLGGIAADEPFLGSRYIGRNFGAPDPIIAGMVNRVGRALGAKDDVMDPYWLSFPVASEEAQPDTLAERAAEGVGLAGGSVIPGSGLVKLLGKGGPVARGVGETIARPFVSTPGRALATEVTAGAGAGAGGYLTEREARKAGVNPDAARMAGELVGGLGAAVAPGMALRGAGALARNAPITGPVLRAVRATLVPFTESGARVRATRRLQELSGGPEADAARITGDTISGLTPAQETGNRRLMALERAILDSDAGLDRQFKARSAEGTQALREALREPAGTASAVDAQEFIQARRDYIRGLLDHRILQAEEQANQAIARLTPALKETEASSIVRRELEGALDAARTQESELWAAVPETVLVPTDRAREAFAAIQARLGRAQHGDIPEDAVRFLDPDRNSRFGAEESVKEMHALYSKLREVARQARARQQRNRANIAGEIADAILADIESVEAAGGPLAAARLFTREMNETFRQGRMGDILGYEASGGATVPPELTLGSTIGRTGAAGAVAADELRRAAGNSPDAMAAMTDFMRRRFAEYAAPSGTLSPDRAADFLRQNAELLDRFPALRREIETATETGRFAGDLRRTVEAGVAEAGNPRRSAEAAFLNAPTAREFQAILQARDPRAAARALLRRAQGDETGQALRGLKAAALDHLTRRGITAKALRDGLADPRVRGAMAEIFDPREMARIGRIAQELRTQEAAAGRLPDVGGVMNDPVNTVISFIGRTLGARAGAHAGKGTSGASLLTAGFASRRVQRILESLTNDRAEQLLRDAIEDPDLFKALLIRADTPGRAAQVERRLVEWLGAETGQATEEMRGRKPAPAPAPAWKSDPVIFRPGGAALGPPLHPVSRMAAATPRRPKPAQPLPYQAILQALLARGQPRPGTLAQRGVVAAMMGRGNGTRAAPVSGRRP